VGGVLRRGHRAQYGRIDRRLAGDDRRQETGRRYGGAGRLRGRESGADAGKQGRGEERRADAVAWGSRRR